MRACPGMNSIRNKNKKSTAIKEATVVAVYFLCNLHQMVSFARAGAFPDKSSSGECRRCILGSDDSAKAV